MSLAAGRLRHRVSIEKPVPSQDSEGATTETWVPAFADSTDNPQIPASIEPLSAREFIAAQTEQGKITGKIIMRYRAGVDTSMRVVHGNTIYSIEGPPLQDAESGLEYMTLMVSSGVNQG